MKDVVEYISTISEPITLVDRALVVPEWRVKKTVTPTTVVDRLGAPVVDAGTFRLGDFEPAHFVDRRNQGPVKHLAGSYLYGGFFWHHFGHFLFESTARLWAADALRGKIEGIIFLRAKAFDQVGPLYKRILELLDIDVPLIFIDEPTEVEQLYVPRQGCGMGALAAGTPAYRQFMQSKLRRITPRQGAKKIYLTREGYGLRRGGIFAETHLRRLLKAEGYQAFSPEQHSFEDQIATYLGADHILGPDSSALHLVGFVAGEQTKIGIVLRRLAGEIDMLPQLTAFTGRAPVVIDAIAQIMQRSVIGNSTWSTFAELDFPQLWRQLRTAGFIGSDQSWGALGGTQRSKQLAVHETKLGCGLNVIWQRPTTAAETA
ncbi:hypothetical protein GCM10010873_35080 [Cypionkella aquatica]|uniref:Glycosyltransferase 61 catalytic domain-containing protein n=1 Tax=Cypionkella aquatica TaxID=1756042 RepID=A0AA37X3E9_9RHOB|nr:glycosyltransferase family 61 protein [Cypionkella aquatica]GLS88534.1 hypothetical protein GCM10010873_35080 [Cypionkella aquatica]